MGAISCFANCPQIQIWFPTERLGRISSRISRPWRMQSLIIWAQPNQRMKLSIRGGHSWLNGSFLIVAAANRSLCAFR
jgi:hypothetical protein